MGKLDRKIALVTGGYSGIGGASTELFAQEGAIVIFVGRTSDKGMPMRMNSRVALFLVSDDSSFITGSVIVADGGEVIK